VIKAWVGSYRAHSARSNENGAWQVYDDFQIHDSSDHAGEVFMMVGCIEIIGFQGFVKFNDLIIKPAGPQAGSRERQLLEIGRSACLSITYEAASCPPLIKK
jgi:hypothetical protein